MKIIDASLLSNCADATAKFLQSIKKGLSKQILDTDGKLDRKKCDEKQFELHGFAWMATYVTAIRALADWAKGLEDEGVFGEIERQIAAIGAAEYCLQLAHGIAMSQDEVVRPEHFGVQSAASELLADNSVSQIISIGIQPETRAALINNVIKYGPEAAFARDGLDETNTEIRQTFQRYCEEKIAEPAKTWHSEDVLIPDQILDELGDLGVFGLTVPEEYGGTGMGTTAMCVVTEELSRGYIGVGSLGTRAEIACELIRQGGTEEQKNYYLPLIASGKMIPTAVFTEPNTGSDMGALTTRAVRDGDTYKITGNKTWITHAARADLMTLMVRTDPEKPGYSGLTMFLAEKPRGSTDEPFPAKGMSGGEIEVLAYRGMKEYEIAFDEFEVPASQVLGGEEGKGFKQLMRTFESARIQTASRAIGVAQNAFDLGYRYANERSQFGQPIINFQRIGGKLAWMIAELTLVRQLTYWAAKRLESGKRSDIEAGMAKLIAARLAWSCADNALQIHGGNGYSTEYTISRVLCDARILNIFEGAAEIQAGIIGRGLMSRNV